MGSLGQNAHGATAADRRVLSLLARCYRAGMDQIALTVMALAAAFSGFVVLIGWR